MMTSAPSLPIFPQDLQQIPVRFHQISRSFSRSFPKNRQKKLFPQKYPQLREIRITTRSTGNAIPNGQFRRFNRARPTVSTIPNGTSRTAVRLFDMTNNNRGFALI
ncbi:hypothetical protein ACVWZA_001078 [Sphingomonas sp. UYAg733]